MSATNSPFEEGGAFNEAHREACEAREKCPCGREAYFSILAALPLTLAGVDVVQQFTSCIPCWRRIRDQKLVSVIELVPLADERK